MQVVVKTPPIDVRIEGEGVKAFLDIIKKSIPDMQIADDDDSQDIDEWDYYKEMKARITPAKVLKIRRENAGLTQHRLLLPKNAGLPPQTLPLWKSENGA